MHLNVVFLRTEKKSICLNAREVAPLAATPNMFEGDPSLSSDSPLAVGVPGEIAGYWEAR